MKLAAAPLVLAGLVAIAPAAVARTWEVTRDHHSSNEVSFTSRAQIVHMTGRTQSVEGSGSIDVANPAKHPTAEVRVDLRTLDTGIEMRNGHMKAVLEAEKYPYATFKLQALKAKKLQVNKPVMGVATGLFTLHGVTKRLTVPVNLTYLPEQDAKYRPGDWVAASAEFKINLSDYKITLPAGILGLKVANEVTIDLDGMAKGL
jgi:polyisoprenoid-binding protein YceI